MRYFIRRVAQLVFVLVVVTFLASIALRFLPGGSDVIVAIKTGPGATDAQRDAAIEELGLDKSIPSQYITWTGDFVTGNWGQTFSTNQSIAEEVKRGLPISLYLMIYGQLIGLALAIPVAVWSAYKQNTRFDRLTTTSAFGLLSMPNYIVAPILLLIFGVTWKLVPYPSTYTGLVSFDLSFPFIHSAGSPIEHFKAFVLPAVTIALPLYAGYMRLLRADMIGTLQSDFITTARAKGVSTRRLLFGHALRPSLFSLVTSAAVNIGALMGGVVIVEQFFAFNGMGRLTVESIFRREYPTVQYGVVILAIIYVLINFVVDLAYAFIDPRVRVGRALG